MPLDLESARRDAVQGWKRAADELRRAAVICDEAGAPNSGSQLSARVRWLAERAGLVEEVKRLACLFIKCSFDANDEQLEQLRADIDAAIDAREGK